MKKITLVLSLLFLAACGGGDSDSGAGAPTTAGDMLPANFIGIYTGVVNLRASALGLSESDTFPITITVTADGMVRFDGDEPDETFTVGVTNAGDFVGSLTIVEDECEGTVSVSGRVDGTNATGTVEGNGECTEGSLEIDVELTGDFNATK